MIALGGRAQPAKNKSTITAIIRAISVFEATFSSRDIVGREHSAAPLSGRPPHGHLENRVRSHAVAIVRILVTRRDQEHPQSQHLDDLVIDPAAIAPVRQAAGQNGGNTETPLNLAQQKNAAVR